MVTQRWQSKSPIIGEILSRIGISNPEIIDEIKGLNFVRAVLLMEQSGCNSTDIELLKELALKQYIAHQNYPGLFTLISEWNVPNNKIKEVSETPIDQSLTFLNYKIESWPDWHGIRAEIKQKGYEVIKSNSDYLKAESSAAEKLKADLRDVERESDELKSVGLSLESEAEKIKSKAKEPVLTGTDSEKDEARSQLEKVEIERLQIKAKREAAELKIAKIKLDLKKAELRAAELAVALKRAEHKLAELR